MKKIIAVLSLASVAALSFTSCATSAQSSGSGESGGMNMWLMILLYVAIFAALYFFMIRPNSKKKKQEQEMRNNLEIGDEITTIGGIVGRVVSIKEDTDSFILETGSDKTKMQFKRWAISTVDTIKEDSNKKADTKSTGFFGRKKQSDDSEKKSK